METSKKIYTCQGCQHAIDEDGFCTDGCNYSDTLGFWTCKVCYKKCENVEKCPNCINQISAERKRLKGNHIQHILDKILGLHMTSFFTGTKEKQNEYITYQLADGAISTEGNERINIHYYRDYRITVKNNLLTFPIIDGNTTNHIMKVLTDAQQTDILAYLCR